MSSIGDDIDTIDYDQAPPVDFSGRVRYRATQLGLEQASLARKSGIAKSQMGKIWHGQSIPGGASLVALARALGVSSEWLIEGTGFSPPEMGDRILSIPIYDLWQLTPKQKPAPIGSAMLLQSWLPRSAISSPALWITRMPAHRHEGAPTEGSQILCGDWKAPHGDGLYLYRYNGAPTVRSFGPPVVPQPGVWDVSTYEFDHMSLLGRILAPLKLPTM